MKLSDGLPEPFKSMPVPEIVDPEGLRRLQDSGWLSKARLREYSCARRHRLAELVEAPLHGTVLLIRTNGERFDAVPEGWRNMSFAGRIDLAERSRHQRIRDKIEVWSLDNLRVWRELFPRDYLAVDAVCRCGRHGLDLFRVLAEDAARDRRRVVLALREHSV